MALRKQWIEFGSPIYIWIISYSIKYILQTFGEEDWWEEIDEEGTRDSLHGDGLLWKRPAKSVASGNCFCVLIIDTSPKVQAKNPH